eukprot:jgi/Chrzof1/2348/Cz11g11250.t1
MVKVSAGDVDEAIEQHSFPKTQFISLQRPASYSTVGRIDDSVQRPTRLPKPMLYCAQQGKVLYEEASCSGRAHNSRSNLLSRPRSRRGKCPATSKPSTSAHVKHHSSQPSTIQHTPAAAIDQQTCSTLHTSTLPARLAGASACTSSSTKASCSTSSFKDCRTAASRIYVQPASLAADADVRFLKSTLTAPYEFTWGGRIKIKHRHTVYGGAATDYSSSNSRRSDREFIDPHTETIGYKKPPLRL